MFVAFGRYIRAFCYLLIGRIDKARHILSQNPYVVQATFDNIIEQKSARVRQYKQAVTKMLVAKEDKAEKLRNLTAEIQKYEQLKTGAATKAKHLVAQHAENPEAIKTHPEYVKCQAAYRDFSSTLDEKRKFAETLDQDLQSLTKQTEEHKVGLQSLLRELDKIKSEKHETIADILSSKEEREIADMLSGITEDQTAQELKELRDLRQEAKAGARMSREMAGLENAKAEAEFLNFAESNVLNDEFDKLIGLTKEKPQQPNEYIKTNLPE